MECNHLRNEYSSAQDACTNISDEYKANLTTISQRLNVSRKSIILSGLIHAFISLLIIGNLLFTIML